MRAGVSVSRRLVTSVGLAVSAVGAAVAAVALVPPVTTAASARSPDAHRAVLEAAASSGGPRVLGSGTASSVGELTIVAATGDHPVAAPLTNLAVSETSGAQSLQVHVGKLTDLAGVSKALLPALNSSTTLSSATVTEDSPGTTQAFITYRLANVSVILTQATSKAGLTDQVTLTSSSFNLRMVPNQAPVAPANPLGQLTVNGTMSAPITAMSAVRPVGSTPAQLSVGKTADGAGVTAALQDAATTGTPLASVFVVLYQTAGSTTPFLTFGAKEVTVSTLELASRTGTTETATLTMANYSEQVAPGVAPRAQPTRSGS